MAPTLSDQAPSDAAPIVVLLHGFAGFPALNMPLARRLRRAGFETRELGYDSWGKSLPEICDRLTPRFARIADSARGPIHLVGHSMGGIVARALIHRQRPDNLGSLIMMGTPNAGSELADFVARWPLTKAILGKAEPALTTRRPSGFETQLGAIDYPLGIIAGDRHVPSVTAALFAGPHDGKVSVASTLLPEAVDHIVLPLTHTLLLFHPEAQRQVEHFLLHGRFDPRVRGRRR